MQVITKTVPNGIKVYKSLARCCRYQHVGARFSQPIFDASGACVGFAALPEKEDGALIYWTARA